MAESALDNEVVAAFHMGTYTLGRLARQSDALATCQGGGGKQLSRYHLRVGDGTANVDPTLKRLHTLAADAHLRIAAAGRERGERSWGLSASCQGPSSATRHGPSSVHAPRTCSGEMETLS